MTNLQKMFQTKNYTNISRARKNRLPNLKRKTPAVLAEPQRLKPRAVSVFFSRRGIKKPRLFCFKTMLQFATVGNGMPWVQR